MALFSSVGALLVWRMNLTSVFLFSSVTNTHFGAKRFLFSILRLAKQFGDLVLILEINRVLCIRT